MARVIFDPDYPAEIDAAIDTFFRTRLGPQIATDATYLAPENTGELARSIGFTVEDQVLYVYAAAPYALYVEEGHVNWRNVHGKFVTAASGDVASGPYVFPPNPFLRAALYQIRTE